MKKGFNIIFIPPLMFLITLSCSKESEIKMQSEVNEINFTYQGIDYKRSTSGYNAGAHIQSFNDISLLEITMVEIFGGKIEFRETGCAYFAPELNRVSIGDGCLIHSQNINGGIIPIDSAKVFIYQSGYLTISFSECQWIDIGVFGPALIETCTAAGTFELTLVNKVGETIEITNGTIKESSVWKN